MRGIADHRPVAWPGVVALQARGLEPDRVVQGPRHGGRGGGCAPRGEPGDHLRVDREHQRVGSRVRGAVRAAHVVVVPRGHIASGKLVQARVHGATVVSIEAGFDVALRVVRELCERHPVTLVNSVNPNRIEGQKTAAFEIVDELGDAPDVLALPVGNAGNITAYWRGFREEHRDGRASRLPRMFGGQASGAAPLVLGRPIDDPQTVATAIRIGNPASWQGAIDARDQSEGMIASVDDDGDPRRPAPPGASRRDLLRACVCGRAGGARARHRRRRGGPGTHAVCVLTGNGLKDPGRSRGARCLRSSRSPRTRAPWRAPSRSERVRVRVAVPASVANLGPGFDILALALQLQNDIRAEQRPGPMSIDAGPDAPPALNDPAHNLVTVAYAKSCAELGVPATGVHFACVNRIPIGRGMGSSAAAALAGVLVATALHQAPWDEDAVLERAAALEGHRDNAAAALLGGLAICAPGAPAVQHGGLRRAPRGALHPRRSVHDHEARQVVPTTFSRADAIFNASRCALLVRALATGDHAGLRVAMQDRWHQDARFALMAGAQEIVDAANDAGASGAALAGAGPSVIALTPLDPQPIVAAMAAAAARAGVAGSDDGPAAAQLRHPRGRLGP